MHCITSCSFHLPIEPRTPALISDSLILSPCSAPSSRSAVMLEGVRDKLALPGWPVQVSVQAHVLDELELSDTSP